MWGLALGPPLFLTLEAEHFPGGRRDGQAGLAVLADRDALIEAVVDDFQTAPANWAIGADRQRFFAVGARREHLLGILRTLHADYQAQNE